jgi:hypothetical protein
MRSKRKYRKYLGTLQSRNCQVLVAKYDNIRTSIHVMRVTLQECVHAVNEREATARWR